MKLLAMFIPIGHAMPGSFLFVIALYWTIQIFRRYMKAFMNNGPPFQGSPSYPLHTDCLQHFDITGYLFVISGTICTLNVIIVYKFDLHGIQIKDIQHITIFLFFLLFGLVSLITPTLRKSIPEMEDVCYLVMAMAFFVEGIIFKFHLFGRNDLDVIAHTLLYNVVFLTVLIIILEINYKNSVLLTLLRAYLTLLHGTWFWQLAFILYNPLQGVTPLDSDKHENLMLIVCMFTWHMGAGLFGMMMTGLIVALIYRRSRLYPGITGLSMQTKNENMYLSLLDPSNDSDSFDN